MPTNENDENAATTRLTRAKAASLTVPEGKDGMVKKTLQTKKTTTTTLSAANTKSKRAALGDVSNVTKAETGEAKEGKKGGKTIGLTSKTTQTAGVQKLTRTNASRTALGSKDTNKKPVAGELKRPASGAGVGNGLKKRAAAPKQAIKEETPVTEEEEPPRKRQEIEASIETVPETVDEEEVPDIKAAFAEAVADLDAEDVGDPLMVSEYVVEIFEYLRELELVTLPNPDYMDYQTDLEWKMRGILVDWLIEVHTRFHLLPETLFLAVNIIDRFLSAKACKLEKLQLVGVTAMFIASKYEEILSPHVANFRHVADDGFTIDDILEAERHILHVLQYDVSYPNPMNFLRRISKADNYDIQTRTLGKYLMEISLLDHRFMKYTQSHISAAAMYLARLILESGPWVCPSPCNKCNRC